MSRAERKQLTHDRILHAAGHLFVETGYYNTKTDEIAKRARVSHGSVFAHFKSKQKMLCALMMDLHNRAMHALRATEWPQQDALGRFKAAVRYFWYQQMNFREIVCAYMSSSWEWDEEDELEFAKIVQELRAFWRSLIEDACQKGELNCALDLDRAVEFFGAAYRDTFRRAQHIPIREAPLDEIIDALFVPKTR